MIEPVSPDPSCLEGNLASHAAAVTLRRLVFIPAVILRGLAVTAVRGGRRRRRARRTRPNRPATALVVHPVLTRLEKLEVVENDLDFRALGPVGLVLPLVQPQVTFEVELRPLAEVLFDLVGELAAGFSVERLNV